jgi:hypothetical protein
MNKRRWWGKMKAAERLKVLDVSGRIILKESYDHIMGGHVLDLSGSGKAENLWSCKHGDSSTGYSRYEEFFEKMRTC